jgi:hypothetical protein
MILFFNTYLTPTTLKHSYNRGLLHTDNKIEVFKYALESIAPIYEWSQVIIQFELAPEFQNRYDELTKFIINLFPNQKNLSVRPGIRNTHQKQWQKTVEELKQNPDKMVFFSCNHDHVFTDSRPDYFHYCVDFLKKYEDEYFVSFLSGYHESIEHLDKSPLIYEFDGPLIKRKLNPHDSFLLISKSLLREWWCTIDLGNDYLPRTDEIKKLRDPSLMYNFFVLARDMFAHYDGYHNFAAPCSYYLKHCPAITIPKGFFTNDIIINYNNGRKDETVIDWATQEFKATNPNGSDYFYLLEELPMVWRKHIKQINNNLPSEIDYELNFGYRMNIIEKALKFYVGQNPETYNYLLTENEKYIQYLYKRGDFRMQN